MGYSLTNQPFLAIPMTMESHISTVMVAQNNNKPSQIINRLYKLYKQFRKMGGFYCCFIYPDLYFITVVGTSLYYRHLYSLLLKYYIYTYILQFYSTCMISMLKPLCTYYLYCIHFRSTLSHGKICISDVHYVCNLYIIIYILYFF